MFISDVLVIGMFCPMFNEFYEAIFVCLFHCMTLGDSILGAIEKVCPYVAHVGEKIRTQSAIRLYLEIVPKTHLN